MAVRSNLVNKQYNSPINLYSQKNVNEALSKQTQKLYNGGVGIDFHQLSKPTNLANSAVLRMLEEEERSGRQKANYSEVLSIAARTFDKKEIKSVEVKTVKGGKVKVLEWHRDGETEMENINCPWRAAMGSGFKRVAWPPPPDEEDNYTSQSEEPSHLSGSAPNQGGPVRQAYQQPPHSTQPQETKKAASPAPPAQNFQPANFEPPKTTVTLLTQAPVRQQPPPVFESQPATIRVRGGARMRGDQKWPPESVKQQSEAENAARIALAKGPACRPRRVRKDYTQFFAQHALNPTYPGYRAPPGTQHYIEEGTSNL